MDAHEAPFFVATFTRAYTDEDLELAKSGLMARGFNRLRKLNSRPPKLTAKFGVGASEERIREVLDFLRTVPHCEAQVRYPGDG